MILKYIVKLNILKLFFIHVTALYFLLISKIFKKKLEYSSKINKEAL